MYKCSILCIPFVPQTTFHHSSILRSRSAFHAPGKIGVNSLHSDHGRFWQHNSNFKDTLKPWRADVWPYFLWTYEYVICPLVVFSTISQKILPNKRELRMGHLTWDASLKHYWRGDKKLDLICMSNIHTQLCLFPLYWITCNGPKINGHSQTSLDIHQRSWSPKNEGIGWWCWIWAMLSQVAYVSSMEIILHVLNQASCSSFHS